MIKPTGFLPVLIAICVFVVTACSKKETMEVDNETQSVVDYAIADQEFMGLVSAACKSAINFTTPVQDYYFVPSSYDMSDGKERTIKLSARRNGQAKDPGT